MVLNKSIAEGLLNVIKCCQNLCGVVDYGYGVLVVGGGLAVFGAAGPSVGFDDDVFASHVDHGLDGYAHAVFNQRAGAAASVVGDVGVFVHLASYAVSAHFANNAVAVAFAVCLDGVGDVADAVAHFAGFDPLVVALLGDFTQAEGFGGDLADGEGVAHVAVEAVELDYGVYSHDVALAQCVV